MNCSFWPVQSMAERTERESARPVPGMALTQLQYAMSLGHICGSSDVTARRVLVATNGCASRSAASHALPARGSDGATARSVRVAPDPRTAPAQCNQAKPAGKPRAIFSSTRWTACGRCANHGRSSRGSAARARPIARRWPSDVAVDAAAVVPDRAPGECLAAPCRASCAGATRMSLHASGWPGGNSVLWRRTRKTLAQPS